MRRNLRPPLPPRPSRNFGRQLNSGFETLGQLISACFHLALAAAGVWIAYTVMNPILSRWSPSWGHGDSWLKSLLHQLFN